MKMIYWADIMNDIQEEAKDIQKKLKEENIKWSGKFDVYETPKALEIKFDVLFFDWGGMSMGNSMLEHFCKYILEHAKEHPSRIYIMTSQYTKYAMKDMMIDFPEIENISNVFLELEDALPYLKG